MSSRSRMGQRVVIMEGPDGCGKTEIGKALAVRLKVPYFKVETEKRNWVGKKFKQALEFDQTYIAQFLQQTGHSCVIDRAYPSEWVYSQVFGRETNHEVIDQVDRQFAKMGAIIVLPMRHSYDKNRFDELVPKERLGDLHEKYLDFIGWTDCNTIKIMVDSYGNDLKKQLPALMRHMNFSRDKATKFHVELDRNKK